MILVDGSGNTRPGLGDDENSLDVVSDELSSGGRVEDLDLDSGEGEGGGSGLAVGGETREERSEKVSLGEGRGRAVNESRERTLGSLREEE